ncbi:MAG: amidohydrolase family protein [bacterium]
MIDSHYHLEESLVSLSGLVRSMDDAGVSRTALIPAVCPPIGPLPGWARRLTPYFRRYIHGEKGLRRRAMVAMYAGTVKKDGKVNLFGAKYEIIPQPDNDAVARAVASRPDRFVGYVWVNPAGPADAVSEAEGGMSQPGMIGVKAHPFWHDYAVRLLSDTAALCEEKGRPLLVHLGVKEKGDFRLLPDTFPNLKIIYAHAGIPYSSEVCRLARRRNNVFVDLSSSQYVDLPAARKAIEVAGADKCLFGTDGPYMHAQDDRFDYSPYLAILNSLRLSDAERERVGWKNFKELADLEEQ